MRKWSILVNIVKICDSTPTDTPLQISSPKKLTKSDRPTNSPLNSPWISPPADTPPQKSLQSQMGPGHHLRILRYFHEYRSIMSINADEILQRIQYTNSYVGGT